MTVITVENVEVGDSETVIIEPQETDKNKNRIFAIANRDQEIEVKAMGSNDMENWETRETKIIPPNNADSLIVGPFVCWVKLIGKTTTPGTISNVDASLVYCN